jgi:hypothetical protein
MAGNEQQALDIHARMAALRDHMRASADHAAASARRWSDWRYYVERFPLMTTVLAAGVGYLLVPRRPRVVVPDAKALAELVKHDQLVISQRPKAVDSQSVAKSVLGIVAAGAARAALSYIGDRMTSSSANGPRQARSERRQQPEVQDQPAPARAPRYPR